MNKYQFFFTLESGAEHTCMLYADTQEQAEELFREDFGFNVVIDSVVIEDAKIPTVPLAMCEFDKTRRVLKLASEYCGMPAELMITSHYTGKHVRFVAVGEDDALFDQDQWDGEQQIYRPIGDVRNVNHLVIYHAY